MSRLHAPEVATPRLMAETLAVFYAFGGLTGLLAALGVADPGPGRWVLVGLGVTALTCAAVWARWAARWPRGFFHLPVNGAAVLVAVATAACPDAATAVVCAAVMCFVAVDAYFFFPGPLAFLHLLAAVLLTTGGLLAQGDVQLPTALALDTVLVALGTVTRRLVLRASSASRDPLTGLANRRGFDDALQEFMGTSSRTGGRLSAALLDLDHFKQINDQQGHEAGDRVLQQVAETWRVALPAGAVLARHGGDEFALLLPGVAGPAALETVRRLCALLPDVGVSCGVAEHAAAESAAQLMRRADATLYAAKAAGRGRCELDGAVGSELAGDLAAALTDGAIEVHFQPLVTLADGEVFGVEALARWTHPVRGQVSPLEFIAVAEQSGLIVDLGAHVLETAVAQLTALRCATGRQLRLGVNVSVQEVADPGWPQRVRAVLDAHGWPADHLVVEVTESVLEADSATVVAALDALRALGSTVAVDDFGTGYSSLSRLDTLPVHSIKLDTGFIAAITTSPRRAQLVASMIGLADTLGLGLVAEGVETPEQDALLRTLGCRYAQGWLYGRPMALAGLVEFLDRRTSELAALPG